MNKNTISTPRVLLLVGIGCLILAFGSILGAVLVYLPVDPEFSIFTTYLSDIGDTPGLPGIILNTGVILAAPLRFIVIVLVLLRLGNLTELSKTYQASILTIGGLATIGTVLMTAVPFSVGPSIHKAGIGLYFLGVVFLQLLFGVRELGIKGLSRLLPLLSLLVVACFLVFLTLFLLYESGNVSRTTPVFWEWLCVITSLVWLLGHSLVLGREDLQLAV